MEKITIEQFIELYGNCFSPAKGEYIPMDLTPKYTKILKDFDGNRINLVLKKTRQTGLSNLMLLYAAYILLTGEVQTIVYVSNRFDLSKNFIRRLRDFLKYHGLDKYIGKINNVSKLEFNNNMIVGIAATPDSFRGYGADVVLVDEAAYISKLKDFLSTVIPTVGPNGRIIIGSSPNGFEFFESIWSHENGFSKNTLHWSDTTRFDKEWVEQMRKGLNNNELAIRQEIDGDFIDYKEEKSKTISLRVEEDLYNSISKQLLINNESTSDYIRRLIKEDINR